MAVPSLRQRPSDLGSWDGHHNSGHSRALAAVALWSAPWARRHREKSALGAEPTMCDCHGYHLSCQIPRGHQRTAETRPEKELEPVLTSEPVDASQMTEQPPKLVWTFPSWEHGHENGSDEPQFPATLMASIRIVGASDPNWNERSFATCNRPNMSRRLPATVNSAIASASWPLRIMKPDAPRL